MLSEPPRNFSGQGLREIELRCDTQQEKQKEKNLCRKQRKEEDTKTQNIQAIGEIEPDLLRGPRNHTRAGVKPHASCWAATSATITLVKTLLIQQSIIFV